MKYEPGTTEYVNAHQRVRKVRGDPDVCVECGGQAVDWASITGDHDDPQDYQPMCRSCHVSMDQRRAHDEREDHEWAPGPYKNRCAECRRRWKRQHYHDRKARDPEWYARIRELNRESVARYRRRKERV